MAAQRATAAAAAAARAGANAGREGQRAGKGQLARKEERRRKKWAAWKWEQGRPRRPDGKDSGSSRWYFADAVEGYGRGVGEDERQWRGNSGGERFERTGKH